MERGESATPRKSSRPSGTARAAQGSTATAATTEPTLAAAAAFIPFEDWCIEHVGYSSPRYGMTKTEFIAYFEPEFRAEYEELAEEWKAEQE